MSVSIPQSIDSINCLDDVYQSFAFRSYDFKDWSLRKFLESYSFAKSPLRETVRPDNIAMRYYLNELLLQELESKHGRYHIFREDSSCDLLKNVIEFYTVESIRVMQYLLCICLREIRHTKDSATSVRNDIESYLNDNKIQDIPLRRRIKELFSGLVELDFFFDSESTSSIRVLTQSLPEEFKVEEAIHLCLCLFEYSTFPSSNYGGDAWIRITECAESILTGVITPHLGMDNAFCLSHNCGAIFNKPFLYKPYHGEWDQFQFLLDVQRSGQLPQALNGGYLFHTLGYDHHEAPHGKGSVTSDPIGKARGSKRSPNSPVLELLITLNELNPEYQQPFSFFKLQESGCVGVYDEELAKAQGMTTEKVTKFIKSEESIRGPLLLEESLAILNRVEM